MAFQGDFVWKHYKIAGLFSYNHYGRPPLVLVPPNIIGDLKLKVCCFFGGEGPKGFVVV